MSAVDTNILIYAHRGETEFHDRAVSQLRFLAAGAERWALPVFCVTEFMRVVTHKRVFSPPSSIAQAAAFIEGLVALLLARSCGRAGRSSTAFSRRRTKPMRAAT